jgi:hypothetical protein
VAIIPLSFYAKSAEFFIWAGDGFSDTGRQSAEGQIDSLAWQSINRGKGACRCGILAASCPIHFFAIPLDPVAVYARSCAKSSPPPTTRARWAIFWPIFSPGAAGRWRRLPCRSRRKAQTRPALERLRRPAGQTPDLVFSTHMDTVPPYIPFSEDAEFHVRARCFRRQGNHRRAGRRRRGAARGGISIGLLFVRGEERDSAGAKAANLRPRAAAS